MSEELKPCPFCGCEAEMSRDFCTAGGKLEWEAFRVFHNCKAVGPMATDRFGTEAEAAEAWNRRAERTCFDFGGEDGTNGEHYDFACSACGFCCDLPEPAYCPWCGAKVVER